MLMGHSRNTMTSFQQIFNKLDGFVDDPPNSFKDFVYVPVTFKAITGGNGISCLLL